MWTLCSLGTQQGTRQACICYHETVHGNQNILWAQNRTHRLTGKRETTLFKLTSGASGPCGSELWAACCGDRPPPGSTAETSSSRGQRCSAAVAQRRAALQREAQTKKDFIASNRRHKGSTSTVRAHGCVSSCTCSPRSCFSFSSQ